MSRPTCLQENEGFDIFFDSKSKSQAGSQDIFMHLTFSRLFGTGSPNKLLSFFHQHIYISLFNF